MYMRMPVETTAIRVDGAEDTGFQPPFSGGIQQILHRQTAHVIQQPTVAFEHRPQRVRQGEDQVYPVAIWLEEASTTPTALELISQGESLGSVTEKTGISRSTYFRLKRTIKNDAKIATFYK